MGSGSRSGNSSSRRTPMPKVAVQEYAKAPALDGRGWTAMQCSAPQPPNVHLAPPCLVAVVPALARRPPPLPTNKKKKKGEKEKKKKKKKEKKNKKKKKRKRRRR